MRINLKPSSEESPWISMPDPAEVFTEPSAIPDHLLLPLLKVDGGEIHADFSGIPIVIIAHEVGIDDLTFDIVDGLYQLRCYDAVEIDNPQDTRTLLEAYIEENHDGPEELADENAELFDDVPERGYLVPIAEHSRYAVETESCEWLQHRGDAPTRETDGLMLKLADHPHLFGAYFSFWQDQQIHQVFQCT